MSDTPQVINTLRTKANNLEGHIARLEREMKQARKDLAHVRAAIVMFEPPRLGKQPAYMNVNGLFKRREMSQMCKEALQANGPMTTRELAAWVILHKGLDDSDRYLKTAVALRVVQALRMQEKRGTGFNRVGKTANVIVWGLKPPAANTPSRSG